MTSGRSACVSGPGKRYTSGSVMSSPTPPMHMHPVQPLGSERSNERVAAAVVVVKAVDVRARSPRIRSHLIWDVGPWPWPWPRHAKFAAGVLVSRHVTGLLHYYMAGHGRSFLISSDVDQVLHHSSTLSKKNYITPVSYLLVSSWRPPCVRASLGRRRNFHRNCIEILQELVHFYTKKRRK